MGGGSMLAKEVRFLHIPGLCMWVSVKLKEAPSLVPIKTEIYFCLF